ncbi:MAG TPA: hypothetical protein VFS56_06515 [Gemmatimonadaceae bacterium]|nr:hypothetical protein [Gemmatimonadaceae bacterium]
MKDKKDAVDREKAHPTVAESFMREESEPIVEVRAGDVWTDFVRESPDRREPETPRPNGTVPLLDEMTGIRQWE